MKVEIITNVVEEKLNEYRAALNKLIEEVPVLVPLTPNHPRGEARPAWIHQAKYWLGEIDKLKSGDEMTFKDSAMFGFCSLFLTDFQRMFKKDNPDPVPIMTLPAKVWPQGPDGLHRENHNLMVSTHYER